ncbi:MAG TPA: DUF2269 domain-containing protein [Actinomycetota bacterium]|nr:DUF2269 domain-containing protein [Actinomycetota bacterium]
MPPSLQKMALAVHVLASVGWVGAAAAFLGLGVVGLTSPDPPTVRGAYLAMDPAARLVLVPLALGSLATGLVSSLGTRWGLLRHYWVIFKLLINLFATLVLVLYLDTFRVMADVAADQSARLVEVRNPSPVLHAALALVLLITAAALGVYKPRGKTRYGRRRQA